MTISAANPTPALRAPARRGAAYAAAFFLGLAVAALAWRLSPQGTWAPAAALGALALAAAITLGALAPANALANWTRLCFGAGALAAAAAASGLSGDKLSPAFGLVALGGLAWLGWSAFPRLRAPSGAATAAALVLMVAIALYSTYYVVASRDLMIADFMTYRLISIAIATLIDRGQIVPLLLYVAGSLKNDYAWIAGMLPGLALAAGAPLSRAVYEGAILALYATPAILALGWLAREIARRAGLCADGWPVFAVVLAAVVAAYPTGLAVAARGMPDIGGIALYVLALNLADRFTRALAAPVRHEALARAPTRKLALSLVACVFALFLFRRWYAFAAAGLAATLALELAFVALRNPRAFRWRATAETAALAALTLLGLASPILADWLGNLGAHDYGAIYAAYRKSPEVFIGLVGDWFGFGVLAIAALGAASLLFVSKNGRLLRLTLGAAIIAALLFFRVQTPYVHHAYLIFPAVTACLASPLALLFQRSRLTALMGLAALAGLTLTPAGGLLPKGLFPTYALPHPPREDLAELERMKDWVDAHARPDNKVCGLGSSYTFSGQLIDELWQLRADRSPLYGEAKLRPNVTMSDVDTVEGAPNPAMKDCAFLIVGDPVQTHLDPAYQQTVIVPTREILTGEGIGRHYRRTGDVFRLEKGVSAIVFERVEPMTDVDMKALAERWRAARAGVASP